MSDRLTYRGGTIIGSAAGRMLHCLVRPAQPGMLPPAGEYRVAPPTNDPIYGPVALLIPANGGSAVSVSSRYDRPGGIASMTKQELPGGVVETNLLWDLPSPGSSAFVLATRAIAGRNCLVVTGGTELFDAIGAAGGAAITVS